MDALRKQASKIREQVAKQQQAVFKQFTGHGVQGNNGIITDEAELQRHQQLDRLYASTRTGKHFQRDIVRGVEGIISTGTKQLEVASKLGEDCRKYACEGLPGTSGALAKASLHYGNAHVQMEKERDIFHRALSTQVAEPLRAMVMGSPLEDARQLAQRYDRLRQEAESQGQEVGRRQLKTRDLGGNPDNIIKLQVAEAKMNDLTSAMLTLGKEAAAAMTAVEAQQQRLTLQRLIAMVEAERAYHQKISGILDQLYAQMITERQQSDTLPTQHGDAHAPATCTPIPPYEEMNSDSNPAQKAMYFLAEVMHAFEAETDGELSLAVGDYVVVRQVSATGWSEGECKGKAGWFPSSYVERRQRGPASKVAEAGSVF